MPITPSALRADIYNLLDKVVETGEPLEIERRGVILTLSAPRPTTWLDHLPRRRNIIVGDPDDIVEMDWSEYWDPEPL